MVIPGGPIVVLCEDGNVPNDSLLYGIEIANRVGTELKILLLHGEIAIQSKQILEKVKTIAAELQANDIGISIVERSGDRASEFLKYFALNPAPALIIWGIGSLRMDQRTLNRNGHWFAKVAPDCRWPLVSPERRPLQKED